MTTKQSKVRRESQQEYFGVKNKLENKIIGLLDSRFYQDDLDNKRAAARLLSVAQEIIQLVRRYEEN